MTALAAADAASLSKAAILDKEVARWPHRNDHGGAHAPAPWYKHLYVQVLVAIVLGVLLGHFYPEIGAAMKPLGDGFIKLIKMIIAPIIFCTVVLGIASMEDMKKVGRVGGQGAALFRGRDHPRADHRPAGGQPVAARRRHERRPVARSTRKSIATYTAKAGKSRARVDFLLNIIPDHRGRRLRQGRDPAGAVLRHPVRLCAAPLGERGKPVLEHHRPDLARASSPSSASS